MDAKNLAYLENSQHQNDNTNIYKNNTLKLCKSPLNKFSSYKLLLNEFYEENAYPTDAELDRACLYFAEKYGLTVAPQVKEKIGGGYA